MASFELRLSANNLFGIAHLKAKSCIIPTAEWDGDTGIPKLIEAYLRDLPPTDRVNHRHPKR